MLKKLLLGASVLLLVACGEAKVKSEIVQITGSDTILNVTQQLSEAYMSGKQRR